MLKQLGTWFVVGLPLLIGIAPYAQEGKWAAQGDQSAQSLINMERQWAEADCDGNLSIQTTLADDFQGTAPDGTRYTKGQEIQDTKDSKHTDRECRLGEVKVHFFGENLAVLYGSESRIGKDADGTERIKTLIWTDTWLKRNGQWQIVAAQDNWAKTK